jgi:multidrug efflux pump subunit AcrA (membrane-fusion protein)
VAIWLSRSWRDSSYQATLNQYQGELNQNQALLKSAELTLARYRKLAQSGAGDLRLIGGDCPAILPYRGDLAIQILARQRVLVSCWRRSIRAATRRR